MLSEGRWWHQNAKKIHLWLAFGREGHGRGGGVIVVSGVIVVLHCCFILVVNLVTSVGM